MTPSQRHPLPATAIGAALLCVLSLVARDARAESGLQIAPDHKRTLVSKDVGGQRWSMVYNEDDGTAIGNVYDANGGEPSFVWCRTVATASDTITFECSGADRCAAFPCRDGAWSLLPQVTLPKSFFEPAGKPDDVWVTDVDGLRTALRTAPAGTAIRLVAGAYRLTEPLEITRDDVTIEGSGNQTSFTLEGGVGAPLFVIGRDGASRASGVTLRRMRLDGNREHQAASGDAGSDCILADGVDGLLLEDLKIESCSRAGVRVANASGAVLRRVEAFDSAGDGLVLAAGTTASRIDTATLRDNDGFGISLLPGSGTNELAFCLVRNNRQTGVRVLGSSGNTIRNSILQANAGDGAVLADADASTGAANNVLRSNQYLENAGHGVHQASVLGAGNEIAGGTFRCNGETPIGAAAGAPAFTVSDDPELDACVP